MNEFHRKRVVIRQEIGDGWGRSSSFLRGKPLTHSQGSSDEPAKMLYETQTEINLFIALVSNVYLQYRQCRFRPTL